MPSEKEEVLANLRACIISSQGGIRATAINKDYQCLVGEYVPFKRLGFPTLESFLSELPNVDVIQKGGEWWVQAKLDQASSHIQKLVQGQNKSKSSRKPRRKAKFTPRFSTAQPTRSVSKPSYSVPHFMQTKTSFQPSPKPKTRYIPPASGGRSTASSVHNNDWAQKSMPTVVIEPKAPQPPSEPVRSSEEPTWGRPIRPSEERGPPIRSPDANQGDRRDWPVAVRMRNSSAESSYKGFPAPARSPLLPTPTQFPTPLMPLMNTNFAPVDLHPLPRMDYKLQPPTKPIANQPPPIHHFATKVPPTKPHVSKPHKPSMSDRLKVYQAKNKTDAVQDSLREMSLQPHVRNGSSATQPDETRPSNSTPAVKYVNPISYNKNKHTLNEDPAQPAPRRIPFPLPEYALDDSSYFIKLVRYAEAQKWPAPEFYVFSRCAKKGYSRVKFFLSRVCVTCTPVGAKQPEKGKSSSFEFSTYPDEFDNANAAMDSVAKKAYETLVQKTTIKLPETREHKVIFERINQMIRGKPQGVWLFQIEKQYSDLFNEVLPSNLPDLIGQECSDLEVTKLAESYCIIRPKKEVLPNSPANFNDIPVISKVSLPNDDNWDVFVSKVKSMNEVYVRLIGENYSDLFEAMSEQMDEYYMNGRGEEPGFIQLGSYYAYLADSDGSFRCLVTAQVDNGYQIYLIDVGDVEVVKASSLSKLLPSFYELPSQALPCYLETLDNFDFALTDSNAELSQKVLDNLIGKSFAGAVQCREPIRLLLINTENDGYDIIMNQVIRELVMASFADPKVALQEKGFLKTVIVSCIDSMGRVFIQKPSWTLDCLNDKFSMICNGAFEILYVDPRSLSYDKLYCASNFPTRVTIIEELGNGKLLVDCVDTGGVMEIDLKELFEVPLLDDILPHIPPQAVQVLMHDINDGTLNPEQAKNCLDAINSTDQPTIGKVISCIAETPVMELFVRNEKNRFLMSLNQNIIMLSEDETAFIDDDASSVLGSCSVASFATNTTNASKADTSFSSRPGTSCSRMSSDTPSRSEGIFNKGPVNLKINDELDVYVTRIASPQNFTVIPVKYLTYLNKLIHDMTVFYNTMSHTAAYTPQLKECVAGYSNGSWFRVQIDKELDSDCFSGKFLDQGHMEMFATKCLRALNDQFKKLPYLAFKGQLHGVKPVNGKDWEVDDCIRVKEMIQEKKLVSIVRDVVIEDDGKKLSLEIIDTTTPTDIYVSRQLVLERRALPSISAE